MRNLLVLGVLILMVFALPGLPPAAGHGGSLPGVRPHSRAPAYVPPPNLQVSHTEPQPAGEPTVAVNKYGTVMVDWEEQGKLQDPVGPMGMAFSRNDGQSFGPQTISKVNGSLFEYDVSTAANSPNGTFWVGYGVCPIPGMGCSLTGTVTSQDYVTAAWNNGTQVSAPDPAITYPADQTNFVDRDWVASTPNGTVYQVVDDASGATNNVYMSAAYDGIHFHAPQVIYSNNGIPIDAFAWNNSLWGAADMSASNTCVILLSSDGGATWAATPSTSPDCDSAQGGNIEWQVTFGAAHTLDLTYVGPAGIEFVSSPDLGATWTSPVLLSGTTPSGTSFQTPTIATDPATNETSVIWLDTRANTTTSAWNVYESDSYNNGGNWSSPRLLSDRVAGYGTTFWPGDFIGSTLTPWGTAAGVWGGDDPNGTLQTYFAQLPLEVPRAGNLTVHVQTSNGTSVPGAQVSVPGYGSAQTNLSGNAAYNGLAPATYQVSAFSPLDGSGSAPATVVAGSSGTVTVVVTGGSPPPQILGFTASPNPDTLGTQVNLTTVLTGGYAPVSYRYLGLPPGCASGSLSTLSCLPTATGTFSITVYANDSLGRSATSQLVLTVRNVTVPAPSILGFTAVPSTLYVGNSTHLSVNVTGGTLPYSFAYTGLPAGCTSSNSSSENCIPTQAGNYSITVIVTDAAGKNASATTTLSVRAKPVPPPAALAVTSFTISPNNVTAGTSTSLSVSASGGQAPYTYQYAGLPTGCLSQNLSRFSCAPSQAGQFRITVTVTDVLGHSVSAVQNLTVRAPASSANSSLVSPWDLVGVAVLVVAILVIVYLARRRHIGAEPGAVPAPPPSEPPQ